MGICSMSQGTSFSGSNPPRDVLPQTLYDLKLPLIWPLPPSANSRPTPSPAHALASTHNPRSCHKTLTCVVAPLN